MLNSNEYRDNYQPKNVTNAAAYNCEVSRYTRSMKKSRFAAENIRLLRKGADLSLRSLADSITDDEGVSLMSHANIDRIEKGTQSITLDQLYIFADHFGVTIAELITENGVSGKAGIRNEERLKMKASILHTFATIGHSWHEAGYTNREFSDPDPKNPEKIWLDLAFVEPTVVSRLIDGESPHDLYEYVMQILRDGSEYGSRRPAKSTS